MSLRRTLPLYHSKISRLGVGLWLIHQACCREVGKRRGLPCQEFCVKSDLACGSTIGPILSSGLGCRTVDVGSASLAMHSIREMCSVDDCGISYQHFLAFFEVRKLNGLSTTLHPSSTSCLLVNFMALLFAMGGDTIVLCTRRLRRISMMASQP